MVLNAMLFRFRFDSYRMSKIDKKDLNLLTGLNIYPTNYLVIRDKVVKWY